MAVSFSHATSDGAASEDMVTQYPIVIERQQVSSDVKRLNELRPIFDKYKPSAAKPISHESTAVLLLSYDNAAEGPHSFNVAPEVKELEKVLASGYNFTVENKVIQTKRAQAKMNRLLSEFVDTHDKEHALLIIYYGGHGWHSKDRVNGFNLTSQNQLRMEDNQLTEGTYVAWESAEHILRDTDSDILVIFDCCDSGYIKQFRAPSRTFEYLVACDRGAFTPGPGDQSFTAALIWALQKLKTTAPFTTKQLLGMIKKYPKLATNQNPDLIHRYDMPEPIWISPLKASGCQTRPGTVFRGSEYESIDFRFSFNKRLTAEDVESFAKRMKPLLRDQRAGVIARHVSLQKVSMNNWRKAKAIYYLQRLKRGSIDKKGDDELENRHKRQRTLSGMNAERPGEGAPTHHGLDQEPVTPPSERDDMDELISPTQTVPDYTRVAEASISVEVVQVESVNVILGN